MKSSYRRFIRIFFGLTFSSVLTTALFNAAIDPFGILGAPSITRINAIKPKVNNSSRLFKAVDVSRVEPKTILLGSSRTDIGLDPYHPALIQPAYNLALTGPNIYELRRYFEHSLVINPELKQVILGLDFQMFNDRRTPQPDFREQRLEQPHIILSDLIDVTLSLDTLVASWQTLKRNQDPNPPRTVRVSGMMKRQPREVSLTEFYDSIAKAQRPYQDGVYRGYQSYSNSLQHLRSIIETCAEHNISLILFISPAHATEWEAIHNLALWDLFESWKRDIVALHPVWDFSGYNSITREALSPHMIYYTDSSHYTETAGNFVLNRVMNFETESVPVDFGRYLTPETINQALAEISVERMHWIDSQPGLSALVADIGRYEATKYSAEVHPFNLAELTQALNSSHVLSVQP